MKEKHSEKKKKSRPKINISLAMWLTFSVFAVVLLALFAIVQNITFSKRYREQLAEELRDAGREMRQMIETMPASSMEDVGTLMLSLSNQYGVSTYLFSADGTYIYPKIPIAEQAFFEGVWKKIDEDLSAHEEYDSMIFSAAKNEVSYASDVHCGGRDYYLYVARSLDLQIQLTGKMILSSITTGLLAVVLSFIVSGFFSMMIARPIGEVTAKAKELARGNYDIDFNGNYYYSEVTELSDALNHARIEISKADQMQKELIANVSHDFKTPLTMIKAYASMIQEISGDDPDKRKKHTQVIIDESDRLAMLVNDLLDLSRMQSGIVGFECAVFNLSEDVYSVAKRFDYLVETQGYQIEIDVEEDMYTLANRERVAQVLYNLIGNAVNYTGEDKKIFVRLKRQPEGLRFEVQDTGKGISAEEIPTIWERYYRSSETHKRPVRGSGLGLSIVKNILEKHNFDFGVFSEVGKGSVFYVTFPEAP